MLWPIDFLLAEFAIPPFQSTVPFHHSSPVIVDYLVRQYWSGIFAVKFFSPVAWVANFYAKVVRWRKLNAQTFQKSYTKITQSTVFDLSGNFPWMVGVMWLLSTRSKRAENVKLLENTALSLVKIRRESKHPGKVWFCTVPLSLYCVLLLWGFFFIPVILLPFLFSSVINR